MAAYISAKFEKDDIASLAQVRIIVRNLDEGPVPPSPSSTYFPTHTDDFQTFIVGEYVDDTIGENFDKVANLSELASLTYSPLNIFEDPTASLGSVLIGDILTITLVSPDVWTSDEYIGVVFTFTVDNLIDASNVGLSSVFPNFQTNMPWEITRGVSSIASGTTGITRRTGLTYPGGVQTFLETRFNAYFLSSVESEAFVTATKTEMTALANEQQGTTLVDEDFTAEPTI